MREKVGRTNKALLQVTGKAEDFSWYKHPELGKNLKPTCSQPSSGCLHETRGFVGMFTFAKASQPAPLASNQSIVYLQDIADLESFPVQLHQLPTTLPYHSQHTGLMQLGGVMVRALLDTYKVFMESLNFNQLGYCVQITTFEHISSVCVCE